MFSDRFINVMEETRAFAGDELGGRLALALAAAQPLGPLTLYLSRSVELLQDFTVPARCTLMLAPGVRIAVGRERVLTVLGPVDLGCEPRFELRERASVRLLGPLAAIRPEWWFAEDDSKALAAAAAAAVARRDAEVAQVPLRLTGPYALTRTLDLGALAAGRAIEFVLSGRHPRGDGLLLPTLHHHPQSSGDFPLVRTSEFVRLLIDHVGFDASAERVIGVSRSPAVLHEGLSSGTRYTRCSFWGHAAVSLKPRPDAKSSAKPADTLSFDDCWFQGGGRDGSGGELVWVAPTTSAQLEFSGCAFVGAARSMVEISAGSLDIQGCTFDNELTGESDGCDIRVGDEAESSARPARDGVGLMITEVHVRTRSARHLVASQSGATQGAMVLLTGVVQEREAHLRGEGGASAVITWRRALAQPMVLQGCYFEAPLDVPMEEGVLAPATTLMGNPPLSLGTQISWSDRVVVS